MNFDLMNKVLPRNSPGDKHEHELVIGQGGGWAVRIRYPGKYGPDDFVIDIYSDGVFDDYVPFKHSDLFVDTELKFAQEPRKAAELMLQLLQVAQGSTDIDDAWVEMPGIHPVGLQWACLVLAVCEHRRYPQGDDRGGGRYLPLNFMHSVGLGHMSADEASKLMRIGYPILKRLDMQLFKQSTDAREYTP